jgi:hypothetical protein
MMIYGEIVVQLWKIDNDHVLVDIMFLQQKNGEDYLKHGVNIDDDLKLYVQYLLKLIENGQSFLLVHQMLT